MSWNIKSQYLFAGTAMPYEYWQNKSSADAMADSIPFVPGEYDAVYRCPYCYMINMKLDHNCKYCGAPGEL